MNLRDLKLRLRALVAPRRVERELDEELTFHLEQETRKHIAAGLPHAAARAKALAGFGSPALALQRGIRQRPPIAQEAAPSINHCGEHRRFLRPQVRCAAALGAAREPAALDQTLHPARDPRDDARLTRRRMD